MWGGWDRRLLRSVRIITIFASNPSKFIALPAWNRFQVMRGFVFCTGGFECRNKTKSFCPLNETVSAWLNKKQTTTIFGKEVMVFSQSVHWPLVGSDGLGESDSILEDGDSFTNTAMKELSRFPVATAKRWSNEGRPSPSCVLGSAQWIAKADPVADRAAMSKQPSFIAIESQSVRGNWWIGKAMSSVFLPRSCPQFFGGE